MQILEHRVNIVTIFLLTLIQIGYNQMYAGTVTIDPTTACVGEQVTVSCTLDVPNAATDAFFSILTNFIVGNSDAAISETAVDAITGTHGGVDLSKLMATASGGTTKSVMGNITLLSYTTGDNGTRLGCASEYFINGNTNNRDTVSSTTTVLQANPPLTPTNITLSLSSLSPTDCTNTLISWPSPDSDRAIDTYYVFRNSSLLANIPASNTQYTDTYQLMVNTPYSYSVVASSCAGNSSAGVDTVAIAGYSLVNSPLYLSYDKSTGMLTVDWGLVPGNELLLLVYSLQLNYSHSQYGTTNQFAKSSNFSLISDTSIYSVQLTSHSFSTPDGVVTNITACITIASQCGTAFSGITLCGFFNSENPPTTTQPTTPTVSVITSTPAIVPNATSDATQPSQPSQPTTSAEGLPVAVIAGAVGGGAVILFILIIILVVIMLCICCGKKSESSKYPDQRRSDDNVELSGPGHSTDNIYPSEATYSQINKTQKPNPADLYSSVHKQAPPEKELLYADLDIVTSQTGRVHPPIAPHTNYTDLAQFPAADQTLYASVHTDGPN